MHSTSPLLPNRSITIASYLSLTCLQWSADGELSTFDLQLVLCRLARVDQHVATIWVNNPEIEPCPSISRTPLSGADQPKPHRQQSLAGPRCR